MLITNRICVGDLIVLLDQRMAGMTQPDDGPALVTKVLRKGFYWDTEVLVSWEGKPLKMFVTPYYFDALEKFFMIRRKDKSYVYKHSAL